MREAGKSYLWCTEAWFRTKPGTTPRTSYRQCTRLKYSKINYDSVITKEHLYIYIW